MKKSLLIAAAALAFAGAAQAEAPYKGWVGQLIVLADKLNDQCRGGSGDAAATKKACDWRANVLRQINEEGWCWGPASAIGADKRWVRCGTTVSSTEFQAFAVFQGSRKTPPMQLSHDACEAGEGARARVASPIPYDTSVLHACWQKTSLTGGPETVVRVCVRERGLASGRVTNDCWWVSQEYFVEASSLPRAAF